MTKIIKQGITYKLPIVKLIAENGLGQSEVAARTCYDSFELSTNPVIREFGNGNTSADLSDIQNVDLLEELVWAYHHESIGEHSNLTFYAEGVSRGVLQEHARHRLQNLSVKSTRYTMSNVLYTFLIAYVSNVRTSELMYKLLDIDQLFVTSSPEYNMIQIEDIVSKLTYQVGELGLSGFMKLCLAKDNMSLFTNRGSMEPSKLFSLMKENKKKRNAGDAFKHIVNDNWSVSMVITMNVRALKNYMTLRSSGAAYFQIQWLAESIWDEIPTLTKRLIKKHK